MPVLIRINAIKTLQENGAKTFVGGAFSRLDSIVWFGAHRQSPLLNVVLASRFL
jgi:hypothetical protein